MKSVIVKHRILVELDKGLVYCTCREWASSESDMVAADLQHGEHVELMLRQYLSESLGTVLADADELLEATKAESWVALERTGYPISWDIGRRVGGIIEADDLIAQDLNGPDAKFIESAASIIIALLTVVEAEGDTQN